MSGDRLLDYVDQMQDAAQQARALTDGMTEQDFLSDVRTQLAITMLFVLIGEAAARISAKHPDFPREHAEIPWNKITGMRNLIADDDYRADLSAIWITVRSDLVALIPQLDSIRHWRAQGE